MLTAIAALILIALVQIAMSLAKINSHIYALRLCPDCRGLGYPRGSSDTTERCTTCFGTGSVTGATVRSLLRIRQANSDISEIITTLWACPSCRGSGNTLNW